MAIAYALALKKEKPANDAISGIPTEPFMPVPFVAEQEGSEARKK